MAQVLLESNGAMIDTEFLVVAKAHGYCIADVPVTHLPRSAEKPPAPNRV